MSSRATAVEIIQAVIDQGRSLTASLEAHREAVPEPERGFLNALCFGTVRWYLRLDYQLGQLLSKPLKGKERDIHFLLICGLYQLQYMNKPAHAVINETVNVTRELKKNWATKLVNGVLRNFSRRKEELALKADRQPESRYGFPAWLIQEIEKAYPEHFDSLFARLNEQAPMTLRVNLRRQNRDDYQQQLKDVGLSGTPTPLSSSGLVLETPCEVGRLPGFFDQATCSVQDEAAQLASLLLDARPGQRVLDACSAPGGKTAAILEQTPDLIDVIALDLEPERQERTRQTLQRLNLSATVIVADAVDTESWWDGEQFDRILLDAPCSATGVIRRHPDIRHLRRQEDIERLSGIQQELLQRLWPLLKPGGRLLYATCSVLPQENTHIIERFTGNHPDAREVPLPFSGDVPVKAGIQLLPQSSGHDGFYYSLLEKSLSEKS